MEPSYTIYAVPDELEEEQRIYRSRSDFHVVGKYDTGDPMRRKTERKEEISDVSHRFYDKDGRWVERAQSEERIIPIRREFGRGITETETTVFGTLLLGNYCRSPGIGGKLSTSRDSLPLGGRPTPAGSKRPPRP